MTLIESDEVDSSVGSKVKGRRGSVARIAAALVILASSLGHHPARADDGPPPRPVDLVFAGLRLMLELPPEVTTAVSARRTAEGASDVLVVTRPGDRPITYEIEISGMTARDCPLHDPFPIEIGDEIWIHGRRESEPGPVLLCHTFRDARVLVRIEPPLELEDAEAMKRHVPILRPLLRAVRDRRVIPGAPAPLPPPVGPLEPELVLPIVGLVIERPDDGRAWDVAPVADRGFDALIGALPVFPEVQVAVHRHPIDEVPDCARLFHYLLNDGWSASDTPAPPGWRGLVHKRIGRFHAHVACAPHGGALLEVRIAARPAVDLRELDALLAALATARATAPPLPSRLPRKVSRVVLERSVSVAAGVTFPGTVDRASDVDARLTDTSPYGSFDLTLGWMSRNGVALGATLSAGADGRGEVLAAALEAGVALGLDDEITLVMAMTLEERREALYANRALSLALEMRNGHHRPGAFAWALRVIPIQLASREPAITGLPLLVSWRGLFTSGILIGADLRWVSSPNKASRTWPSEGLAVGLRFGFGALDR